MQLPLVTIAIPTYNRADQFLKNTLENALQQSYHNIEILVSDNCSTDHTPELVQSFSDKRLRYIRQEKNLGMIGNMNFLVEQAKGDYFHMYHDDDIIDKDFIETCMKAADFRRDKGLIVAGSRVIDDNGTFVREKKNPGQGLSTEDFILSWYKKKVHLFFCSSIFGTETLRRTGGFEKKYNYFNDVAAQFNCAAHGERVDVQEIKASFREHSGSTTSASNLKKWCDDSLALLDLACTLAPGKEKELRKIGMRTSADRNYRYASEAQGKLEQLAGYWTVFRKFSFRQFPTRKYIYKLMPSLRYLSKPSSLMREKG